MTQEQRYIKMTETPVSRLIPRLAVPTIISMLVSSIYNMADTYFVTGLGRAQSGAVSVIFSLMALIQAFGFMLGMGSGAYVSKLLGRKDVKTAQNACATGFFTALIFGAFLALVMRANIGAVVRFLGANDDIFIHAVSYCKYILYACPFMMASFVLNNQLRSQGYAVLSMIGITSGGVLNIFLDWLFVIGFNWGISGAAVATMISQMVSFTILILISVLKKDVIGPKISCFRPKLYIYGEIIHTGVPSLCRQALASMAAVVLNKVSNLAGADATQTIAAMGILNKFMLFINSALVGFGQGMQPVCGFNFGAEKYRRVIESYHFCVKVSVVFLSVMAVVLFAFSENIMRIFTKDDIDVIKVGSFAMRANCFTLPLQGYMMMSQFLSQSIGYGGRASIVAMARQGICLIPMYIILPGIFGIVRGLQISQPCSDLVSFVIALFVVRSVVGDLSRRASEENDGKGQPA